VASDYTGNVADTLPGANRLIPAGTKSFIPTTSRSNKVQAGALDRINATSPLGSPNKANPLGAQTS
jgi:hypothetical protein